jgi:hypothetical protein
MYENFEALDRWTGEPLRCAWKATVVAIATRHADATDVRFSVNGRTVTIAMPNAAWVEQKRRTGHVITDYVAAQAAGLYLKRSIESGYDNGRDLYTMTVAEALELVEVVVREAGHTRKVPAVPLMDDNREPEQELAVALPGEPA